MRFLDLMTGAIATSFPFVESDVCLQALAAGNVHMDMDWCKLRETIKSRIRSNMRLLTETHKAHSSNAEAANDPEEPADENAGVVEQTAENARAEITNHAVDINEEELQACYDLICDWLDNTCVNNPPFTLQRLAELTIDPSSHYRRPDKYLRAIRRVVFVTSSPADFPPQQDAGDARLADRLAMPFGLCSDDRDDDMIEENAAAAARLAEEGDLDMFASSTASDEDNPENGPNDCTPMDDQEDLPSGGADASDDVQKDTFGVESPTSATTIMRFTEEADEPLDRTDDAMEVAANDDDKE
ncbi:hypothetical protein THASP1DRAFT_21800 [Thamnocephalis sphaerospora]|uniref:PPP4R2-domain-containing protein n=1 Tax=Thamnocephalis sphaerospora TaxID=78915 RepID=A0A4V1IXC0_9FUNG|nr:hypothetical protein THASP1DRAFT_21800 [Thamnocephalis sphaerospora]|eukprot:RKP10529.1 hypothetical protein THASP1DRAFT_21800 [Thamnocephalis sphaerospora]